MAEILKDLGLHHSVIAANEGNIPEDNFQKILQALKDDSVPDAHKKEIATSFSTWMKVAGTGAGNGEALLRGNATKIFDVVEFLGSQPDDGTAENYQGKQKWAHDIMEGMSTFGMMKQDFTASVAPTAYDVLGRLLTKGFVVKDKGVYVKEQASTERCNLFKTLLRCLPHTENVDIPNAATIIANIICNEQLPKSLKDGAKQAMSSMARINKKALSHSGMAIMNIIAAGGNDDLIFTFISMPELYTNDPACLHDHIELILSKNWMHVSSLVNNVAAKKAEVLVPHVNTLLDKLKEAPAMGAITIGILKEIAKVNHEVIYPHVDRIIQEGKGVTGGSYAVAGCISNAALSKNPAGAADLLLPKLINVLKGTEAAYAPAVLAEVSNMKEAISDRKLLAPYMDYIVSLKPSASALVQGLEDYYAGRSLETLEIRVDAIEVKITELNNKVAESCSSFEDVMAYVDANMADMKDFVGEVVKKLPAPKRLEVVGTLRKTLILHFECVHTGYEFPIISKEWSKWLKMGFSLAKAGKAVFDIGTGNPLGLLSTGVDCVKGIYDAYKTNDDDEFNTYITQPFLTSTEQDQLLEKLRDQGFFEKLAYDNQAPGWYLLHPEEDGTPPGGEAGSVSKVWKKEGYGVGEAISSGVSAVAGELELSEVAAVGVAMAGDSVGSLADAAQNKLEKRNNGKSSASTEEDSSSVKSPIAARSAGAPGGRAAAMRNQMATDGNFDPNVADSKLQNANVLVDLQNRVGELEGKNAKMEKKIQEMEADIARNAAAGGGGCCVIS